LEFSPGNGAEAVKVRLKVGGPHDFTGLTQFRTGTTRPLFQIALASFPTKQGLKLIGVNSFLKTPESSKPSISAAAANGVGIIAEGFIVTVTKVKYAKFCKSSPDYSLTNPLPGIIFESP
jgi:hypothetical protein